MMFMDKKKSCSQISGEVPQVLIDAFDQCVDRLGVTKKRAIAAAVHAFLNADANAQHAWLREVYDHYHAPSVSTGTGRLKGSAAEVGKRAAGAVARGGSKRQPTTGKTSA